MGQEMKAALIILIPSLALASPKEQEARWNSAKLNPAWSIALDKLVSRYQRTQATYVQIQNMRPNGIPAAVCFGLLYRESDNDMTCSPAQGDSLSRRSTHVPRGRIPNVEPPYTFLQAAEDSYYSPQLDHMDAKDWSSIGAALDNSEGFNGWGYRNRGMVSPYVWSGTSVYQRGKFVADGRLDRSFVDKQAGVAAILLRFRERGIPILKAPKVSFQIVPVQLR